VARPLTIALAGDVMLGRLVNENILDQGFVYPWGDVLPLLKSADLFLINLECALTGRRARWHDGEDKAFYFRAEPSVVETLRAADVSFASVANNHICDFGPEGLVETRDVLSQAGIACAGAGLDLAAARAPARLSVAGATVTVVAFADYPFGWAASASSPGVNYTPISLQAEDFAVVEAAIASARQGSDLVIFSIHWGPNMRPRPPQHFRDFARRVIEAGADIFWGHSAHVVQGVEAWNGKLILYDSGDFVDDYAVDAELRNDLSALFLVRARPPLLERLDILPVKIADMQVNQACGWERAWFVQRFASLCAELGTAVTVGPRRVSVELKRSA